MILNYFILMIDVTLVHIYTFNILWESSKRYSEFFGKNSYRLNKSVP